MVKLVPRSYQRPALVKRGDKVVAACLGNQLDPAATSIGEAAANARFIVQACNSHDDLMAQLIRAEKHIRDLAYKLGADDDGADEATEYICAALARAKGGEG